MHRRKLILASASPRRRELLKQAGVEFEVIPAKGEEVITKQRPGEVVEELALQKAKEVAADLEEEDLLLLAADTVVAFDGKILGKPKDRTDAISMLSGLSGNTHSVYTGVAILERKEKVERIWNFHEETQVTMYPMSQAEIEAYVDTGEPMDKAGAYGIQGRCAVFIEKIQGDYNNEVGLPIARIYQEMCRADIAILEKSYYDKR